MSYHCPADLVLLAELLADTAAAIILPYFRQSFPFTKKPDLSPVTECDRLVELALRSTLAAQRPHDAVLGEEFGLTSRRELFQGLVWVIDPIDGTKAFLTGRPTFTVLIALLNDGVPVLGIIDQPILKERWVGAVGWSTRFNGRQVTTRSCAELSAALMSTTGPDMFEQVEQEAFSRVTREASSIVFGGDAYGYGLLALGCQDLVVEAKLQLYDFAALPTIIKGAGGVVSDWSGQPLRVGSSGQVVASGDPRVHEQVLALLQAS